MTNDVVEPENKCESFSFNSVANASTIPTSIVPSTPLESSNTKCANGKFTCRYVGDSSRKLENDLFFFGLFFQHYYFEKNLDEQVVDSLLNTNIGSADRKHPIGYWINPFKALP